MDMGYSRQSGIWSPYITAQQILEATRRWFAPRRVLATARRRTTIGIYVSNCRYAARNHVIKVLRHIWSDYQQEGAEAHPGTLEGGGIDPDSSRRASRD